MTAYPLEVIQSPPAAASVESQGAFVPLLEVAAAIGVEPTTVRRMIWRKEVEARPRKGARGFEVNVATLPPKYGAAFAPTIAAPAAAELRPVAEGETASRYGVARETVRGRAEFRYEAVMSLRKARAARRPGETFGEVECRWLRNFRRSHEGRKVSLRSVKAWDEMLRAGRGNIDALVDGNDGRKQRGARIPPKAKQMFKDEYLRAHQPNIALIYGNVVAVAKVKVRSELCGGGRTL